MKAFPKEKTQRQNDVNKTIEKLNSTIIPMKNENSFVGADVSIFSAECVLI